MRRRRAGKSGLAAAGGGERAGLAAGRVGAAEGAGFELAVGVGEVAEEYEVAAAGYEEGGAIEGPSSVTEEQLVRRSWNGRSAS